MDWGEFFKQTGIVVVAVLAAVAAVLAWIERLMKVRELQRRLEQLDHERQQRISRIRLPSDKEVEKYGRRDAFQPIEDFLLRTDSIAKQVSDMRAWVVVPLLYAAHDINSSYVGQLHVDLVREELAAIDAALEHFAAIVETGLGSPDQFRNILLHTRKLLIDMQSDGVAMLDAHVGTYVAATFLRSVPPDEPTVTAR